MEAGLRLFAERTGLRVRYETPWQGTSRDGDRLRPAHPDGDYRSRVVIFAVGVAEPLLPETPGIEHAVPTTRETREAASYAGKRLFIIGKQNSGFELASGLLQWASPIILASPRPAQLSVNLHSLGGVRARYIQPWEDAELGGGVFILDASIERLERTRRRHRRAHPPLRQRRAVRGRGGRGHRGDRLPVPARSTSSRSA